MGGGKWVGLLQEEIYIRVGSGIPSLIGEVLKEDVSAEVRMFFTCLTLSVLFFFVFIFRSRRGFRVGFC